MICSTKTGLVRGGYYLERFQPHLIYKEPPKVRESSIKPSAKKTNQRRGTCFFFIPFFLKKIWQFATRKITNTQEMLHISYSKCDHFLHLPLETPITRSWNSILASLWTLFYWLFISPTLIHCQKQPRSKVFNRSRENAENWSHAK